MLNTMIPISQKQNSGKRSFSLKVFTILLLVLWTVAAVHLSAFHHHHLEDHAAETCPLLIASLSVVSGDMPVAQAVISLHPFSLPADISDETVVSPQSFWQTPSLRAPPSGISA